MNPCINCDFIPVSGRHAKYMHLFEWSDDFSRLTQTSRYSLECRAVRETADMPASYIVKLDVPCTDSVL